MLSDQLLSELHKLTPTEKLRVVQLLVNDLASSDTPTADSFPAGISYEIPSPYDAFEAAQQLQAMLDDYKRDERNKREIGQP